MLVPFYLAGFNHAEDDSCHPSAAGVRVLFSSGGSLTDYTCSGDYRLVQLLCAQAVEQPTTTHSAALAASSFFSRSADLPANRTPPNSTVQPTFGSYGFNFGPARPCNSSRKEKLSPAIYCYQIYTQNSDELLDLGQGLGLLGPLFSRY